MSRDSRLCPGTRIVCPSCGEVLHLISARNGDFFARCGERRCRTHFYVTCTERLCTVLEVTAEERQRFEADQSTQPEILAALGVHWREAA